MIGARRERSERRFRSFSGVLRTSDPRFSSGSFTDLLGCFDSTSMPCVLANDIGSSSISSLPNTDTLTTAGFTDGIRVRPSGSISPMLSTGSLTTAAAFTDGFHVGPSGSISSLYGADKLTTAAAFTDGIHVGPSGSISSLYSTSKLTVAPTDGIHGGPSSSISSLYSTSKLTVASTDGIHVGPSSSISSLVKTGSLTTAGSFAGRDSCRTVWFDFILV